MAESLDICVGARSRESARLPERLATTLLPWDAEARLRDCIVTSIATPVHVRSQAVRLPEENPVGAALARPWSAHTITTP